MAFDNTMPRFLKNMSSILMITQCLVNVVNKYLRFNMAEIYFLSIFLLEQTNGMAGKEGKCSEER